MNGAANGAVNGGLGPVSALPAARATAACGTAGNAAGADSGFSAALEDAQGPANATTPPGTAAKMRASTPAKAAATPPPAAGREPPEGTRAVGQTAKPAEAVGTESASDKAASRDSPASGDLSQWLPGWPAAAVARACGAPGSASAERQGSEARSATPIDLLRREHSDLAQAGVDPRPAASSAGVGARPAPLLPSAAVVAADAASATATRQTAAETPGALPLPALQAGFMPATAASVAAAAAAAAATRPAFEAQLAATVDSAAFTPALATQVSWLVREGVQHARLSLNPAEMGPVTVQIAVDGTQARVDFSADLAATRAAIESSLPALAAALHESGLKLAGGGVFDGQPRPGTPGERGQSGARPGPPGDASDARSEAPGAGRAPTQAQRGLVDLVA